MNSSNLPGLEQLEGMNPEMLAKMTQAFQRLPKGQLQKMQALMQKAMSGKDITREAQEFERSLPADFQTLMQTLAQSSDLFPSSEAPHLPNMEAVNEVTPSMTEERARELIAKAAADGTLSQEEAQILLQGAGQSSSPHLAPPDSADAPLLNDSLSESPEAQKEAQNSKFGRLWSAISGKKKN